MSVDAVTAGTAATTPPEPEMANVFPPPWMRRLGSRFLNLYAGLALVYLFLPIFVIVAFSFNQPKGRFNLVWQSFTLDNWKHPFAIPELVDAFLFSLKIAAIATAVAVVFGALVSLSLCRYKFRGSGAVNMLLVLPLTTPEIVLGASLGSIFILQVYPPPVPQTLGEGTIIIAHVMFCVSFVALTVKARLRGFDWTLEEAGMDLGANPMPRLQARDAPPDGARDPRGRAALLRAVTRRLHHHAVQRQPRHRDVPLVHLWRASARAATADQRAGDDDPRRERRVAGVRDAVPADPRAAQRPGRDRRPAGDHHADGGLTVERGRCFRVRGTMAAVSR